jgi:hypothetical protein
VAIEGPHAIASLRDGVQSEVHISPSGNDHNVGTLVAPVRTLSKALELSRERKRQTGFPMLLLLHSGIYELPETIRLTSNDAGTAACPLRIEAFGTEEVVLSGGSRLHLEWKPFRNGIYQASVPDGTKTDQLFVNGRRQILARYPNFDEHAHFLNGTAFDAISPERARQWKHPEGAFVHGMQASLWGSLHYRVTGRKSDGSLLLEGGWQVDRDQPMHAELRFIEGIFEELDTPGEWFLDENNATLYFYPPEQVDLNTATVDLVRLVNLIEVGAEQDATIRGITLRGLTFRHTQRTFMQTREQLLRSDWRIFRGGAVRIENAEDVVCEKCYFDQLGGNAAFVSGHARRVGFRTCRIEEAGASGVCFVGRPSAVRNPLFGYEQTASIDVIDRTPGPKDDKYPRNCFVDDCLIARTGRFEKQSAGIEISMSAGIHVTDCSIYGVPRAGINVGDGTWGGHKVDGCDVFDTVLETSDHGAFNAWGRDRWWHLRGVSEDDLLARSSLRDLPLMDAIAPIVLTNSRWACAHGWDIDLDDGSSNYQITKNLCLCGGIKFREGFFRTAEDNILAENTFHIHVWPAQSGDVIQRNIIYSPYQPIRTRGWGNAINSNFLQRDGSTTVIGATRLQRLSGKDQQSLEGDARFVDSTHGDFSLRDGSPAYRIGVKGLPLRTYGVRTRELQMLAQTPDIAIWLRTPSLTLAVSRRQARIKWMGATVRNLVGTGEMSEKGAPTEIGVIIETVPSGTAAARARIQAGDLLLEVNGNSVGDTDQLRSLTNACKRNQYLRLKGLRNQHKVEYLLSCQDGM